MSPRFTVTVFISITLFVMLSCESIVALLWATYAKKICKNSPSHISLWKRKGMGAKKDALQG
jgi:hypothetical protein